MAGITRRDRHEAAIPATFGWPWFDEGRTLAQRLIGLREDMIRVEETTADGAHVVRAEMPGIDPDRDVEITVTDGVLYIRAERHEEKKEKADGGYRSEFRYGSFARALPLPAGAKEDAISASYQDGILEVRVPVDDAEAKSATRTVTVHRG